MPGLSTKGWIKMVASGVVLCVGGPALVMWVQPTEEELFKRYNPELQKRSLENRAKNQEEFDAFVNRLKDNAKSDKNIWGAIAEAQEKERAVTREASEETRRLLAAEMEKQKQEIRKSNA
ncbi:CBP4-domain-containing protein [Pseudovirgaria hyperparasitica]|uniref:Cytochrome b mRNA-processing protein 4 n=1 Tax=Pseudovirgaria hyperparasitica TaxID=470096 RepID=A0A6A6VU17_9PEZI|nr:CBP4-domain-containing protein [Pseudovirgaria hyperparasitica]KAF2753389.1 CBP4-domain-containing protein [Pseudovirgaria hyperparasitica]